MTKNNETYDHIIEIDQYTELILKIPKKMNAVELKGLCTKATKLFNMSEIPLPKKSISNRSRLSIEQKKKFILEFEKAKLCGELDYVAERKGYTPKEYKNKVYQMKYDIRAKHGVDIKSWLKNKLKGDWQ